MINSRLIFILIFFSLIMSSCSYELGVSIKYLKDNQQGHITVYGSAVDTFLCSVYSCKEEFSSDNLKKVWKNVADDDIKLNIKDEQSISSISLIKNASKSLETWNDSKWKEDISFDDFCRYILPYRVKTEIVKEGWRDTLYNRYSYLIENVNDLKEAFKIVHDTIQQTFHQTDISIPYILSAIDLDNIKYGNCTQRCVYEASVMRALGIPVAVDEISEWANYGTSGHSWVSLIYKNQTYTISRETKEFKRYNSIDASTFSLKMPLEEGYDSSLNDIMSFKKRISRVWRNSYEKTKSGFDDDQADKESYLRFNNPFNLTEIWFYDKNIPVKGKVIACHNVENPEKGFDDDTFSYFEGKNPFWITIDMGRPVSVDSIIFFTRNDDNYVIPHNDYELFFFDKGWHSTGIMHSDSNSVLFKDVPQNALYLLKNLSKGKEERIFTISGKKQVWW